VIARGERGRAARHVLLLVVLGSTFALAVTSARPAYAHEELGGAWCTMLDDAGDVVLQTGHRMYVGDQFIDENNVIHEVYRVDGALVRSKKVGRARLGSGRGSPGLAVLGNRGAPAQARVGPVAIYHTHTDESYVPTDGRASIRGAGGIVEVGRSFERALRENGIGAVQDASVHVPHDARAYDRSRATARSLLQQRPAALFDVHRDTGPPARFLEDVRGRRVAKIMFVVGRQNPNRDANLGFAKELKAALDRDAPGLVRGILLGQGKYNQDLHPRALLVEVGGHLNDRHDAERSMSLLADSVASVLTGRGGGLQVGGALRALAWMVGLSAAAAAGYLYLSTGSWEEARARLRGWIRGEFVEAGRRNDEDDRRGDDDRSGG